MFDIDFAVPVDAKRKDDANRSDSTATQYKTSSANGREFTTTECPSEGISHRSTRRGSRSPTSLSPSNPSVKPNLPNAAVAVGVYRVARIDVEPSSDQPEFGRCRSLPDQSVHVGAVSIPKRPLVDPGCNLDPAISRCTKDRASLGVGAVGDRKLMWGVRWP